MATANEVNTKTFVIQRSIDGRIYKSVGSIAAKGLGNNEYTFTDDKLPAITDKLTIYYRLQSIDNDGKISYSEVKQIQLNQLTNQQINIYPNPAKDFITIESAGMKEIKIVDYLGKIVLLQSINNAANNIQSYTLNIKSLPNGVYYLQINNNSKKFIVEK